VCQARRCACPVAAATWRSVFPLVVAAESRSGAARVAHGDAVVVGVDGGEAIMRAGVGGGAGGGGGHSSAPLVCLPCSAPPPSSPCSPGPGRSTWPRRAVTRTRTLGPVQTPPAPGRCGRTPATSVRRTSSCGARTLGSRAGYYARGRRGRTPASRSKR
jgi:hypothetical protein